MPGYGGAVVASCRAPSTAPRPATRRRRGVEVLDHEGEVAVAPALLGEAANGHPTNDAAPEALRGDVPRELRELPPTREATEQREGGLRPDTPPPVLSEHEELADLSRRAAGVVRAVADEHETGQPAAHAQDEQVPSAAAPESAMP